MSFGLIHQSFFDSSINDTDPVTRLVFVAMVVLSDKDGRIDVTIPALARRINIDRSDVERAIAILSEADPESRSRDHEGRRIIPIDPNRSWGWLVVAKERYRHGTADPEHIRAQTRERVNRYRHARKEKDQKKSPDEDTDTDTGVTKCNGGNADVTVKTLQERFETAWAEYPRKEGKRDAWRHYRATVHGTEDADRLLEHLRNYKAQLVADSTEPRFVKMGSSWFANWTDEAYSTAPAAPRYRARLRPPDYRQNADGGRIANKFGQRSGADLLAQLASEQHTRLSEVEETKRDEARLRAADPRG